MDVSFLFGLLTIPLISIALALGGVWLVNKTGFIAGLLIYLVGLGTIFIWQSTSRDLPLSVILLNLLFFSILSAGLLFLMARALDRWMMGTFVATPLLLRELGARTALADSPDDPDQLFDWLNTQSNAQATSLEIGDDHG